MGHQVKIRDLNLSTNLIILLVLIVIYRYFYSRLPKNQPVETTKEKIVSLELSTPEVEIPETPIVEAVEDEEVSEKKPSNTSSKKRRRKRTKSTDKQMS